MVNRREQAAFLLALRDSERGWADVTSAVEDAGSALAVLESLLTPDQPTLDHIAPDLVEPPGTGREGDRVLAGRGNPPRHRAGRAVPGPAAHGAPATAFPDLQGFLDPADQFGVAVVGSRHASARGLHLTREIATTLTKHDITVFSGLAAGIDTAAHRAVVDAGGRTVSVVGTGLRHCYPAENAGLLQEIGRTGAVLSQFWPDAGPAKHHFPMRNAVMSGCSVATVVVEAGEHSGTRIQARLALEHGRHVFLLPEVVSGTSWGREMSERPNTTVLEGPDHLLRVLDDLRAGVPDLIDL